MDCREESEAAGMIADHLHAVVIAEARQLPRFLDMPEIKTGRRDRDERDLRPGPVHIVDRILDRPGLHAGLHRPLLVHLVPISGRHKMMMNVDTCERGHEFLPRAFGIAHLTGEAAPRQWYAPIRRQYAPRRKLMLRISRRIFRNNGRAATSLLRAAKSDRWRGLMEISCDALAAAAMTT
jgi:hypothetical protein